MDYQMKITKRALELLEQNKQYAQDSEKLRLYYENKAYCNREKDPEKYYNECLAFVEENKNYIEQFDADAHAVENSEAELAKVIARYQGIMKKVLEFKEYIKRYEEFKAVEPNLEDLKTEVNEGKKLAIGQALRELRHDPDVKAEISRIEHGEKPEYNTKGATVPVVTVRDYTKYLLCELVQNGTLTSDRDITF